MIKLENYEVELEEKYVSEEYETTILFFRGPKEMVIKDYPEAESTEISIEFPTSTPHSEYATVKIYYTKDGLYYDWCDKEFTEDDVEKLIAYGIEKGEQTMLKIENFEVLGWEHAIRGMRNPMNSWEKSDSQTCANCNGCLPGQECERYKNGTFIGPNDLDLMTRLRNAGTDHRKFMRMITVYVDITAPLYWWKEFDTYKVGTVANSCSTMHKIHDKEFTLDDFSCEHLFKEDDVGGMYYSATAEEEFTSMDVLKVIIEALNTYRKTYIAVKADTESDYDHMSKEYWWQMIQLLPSSYNQKRTVMLNYEVLANIYKSRRNHKLDEWHTFCDWVESLPYSELITGEKK